MNLVPVEQPGDGGLLFRGLRSPQRGLPLLVFLHGNGFAAGVYQPMLSGLAEHFDILALDLPGHGGSELPAVFPGWNAVAELAHSAAVNTGLLRDRPVYGVGHSLGGVLTLLSAHRHPQTYQALVLLDPILFPKRMLLFMRMIAALQLTSVFHPNVKSTRRRRKTWPSREAAFDYLHGRKIFENWTDESLQGFTRYALTDAPDGTVRLSCDPETEATFFATLPRGLWRALRELACPVSVIMGETTYPFAIRASRTASEINSAISHRMVTGGHCYMQENPKAAIQEVINSLLTDTNKVS